jgi:hypothetical protein
MYFGSPQIICAETVCGPAWRHRNDTGGNRINDCVGNKSAAPVQAPFKDSTRRGHSGYCVINV